MKKQLKINNKKRFFFSTNINLFFFFLNIVTKENENINNKIMRYCS